MNTEVVLEYYASCLNLQLSEWKVLQCAVSTVSAVISHGE